MPEMLRRPIALAILIAVLAGCASSPMIGGPPGPYAPNGSLVGMLDNPAHVSAANSDVLWEVLVDVVDDYFRIAHEERVRQIGDVLTEGRLDTFPLTGATLLEPWRGDSVGRRQQLESTLQSIRRRAQVRVIPEAGGFLVEVHVDKELENVDHPERATAATIGAGQHHESVDRRASPLLHDPGTLGWIPLGRDVALEQVILSKLQAKLGPFRKAPNPIPY